MQFYILTYTYLLFSNEVRPALVASLSLSLSPLTHRHLFCFIWLSNQKKRIQERKKCTQDEDAAIKTYIYTKCKKKRKWLLSLKKRKKRNLLFILPFCESLWVMIKIFFSFLHFYNPVFSHLINNTEWMNSYWVLLKKKKCIHALPESPLHLF
jgi:hypothetical protein